jgi:transposase
MGKKYKIVLTAEEREILRNVLATDTLNAQKRKRAQALLLADDQLTDEQIAEGAGLHRRGIEHIRRRFVRLGFKMTLEGKPGRSRPRSLQGEDEARLIALVSAKPDGYDHWTLRLIRDTWVTLEGTHTKTVSHETIRQTLKRIGLDPDKSGNGIFRRKRTGRS